MRIFDVFICLLVLPLTSIAAKDKPGGDKLAREAYLRLCHAINKKDLNAVMKVVDVPWLVSGKPIVEERSKLKKFWKDILSSRQLDSLPWTKFKVEPVAALRDAAKEVRTSSPSSKS